MATPTYTALATTTLSGGETTVTFGSIPSGYRDLVLSYEAFGANIAPYLRFNNDSGNNYSGLWMRGYSSGTQSVQYSGISYWRIFTSVASATIPNHGVLQIMDYSATDKHKTGLLRQDIGADFTNAHAWRWASTSAVNEIDIILFADSFASGSTFSLYGIEA
jgi:hypothetical protein